MGNSHNISRPDITTSVLCKLQSLEVGDSLSSYNGNWNNQQSILKPQIVPSFGEPVHNTSFPHVLPNKHIHGVTNLNGINIRGGLEKLLSWQPCLQGVTERVTI
jgi:hypothetical protein